ncbi:hypothetical protein E1B28_003166 [Marasmius oreades]|uniref:Uncharacterized protein n=1 Tax=Marasmius oreades TaxID=181124 RepID=A0A9P7RLC8_9AGAR|nr:uncharacterized protein E1B28_003166 [Marasmius oreades]KAG7085617.1 hypothetical protein E1B28_003166 [Marasmius oreades]
MITFDIHADRYLTEEEIMVISKYAFKVERLIVNPTSYRYLPSMIFSQLQHVSFPRLSQFDYLVDSVPGSLLHVTRKVDENDPFKVPEVNRRYKIQWEHWQFGTITELTWRFLYSDNQPYYMELWRILDRCKTSLEAMEYQGSNLPCEADDQLQEMIVFPKLRSLVWGYTEDLLPIVYLVQAPRLRELTIRNIVDCPSTPDMNYYPKKFLEDDSFSRVNLLRNFLVLHHDHVSRLQAVHLYGCRLDYVTLQALLTLSSDLRTLTLYAINPEGERPHYFDALLTQDKDRDCLTTLTISPATKDLTVYLQKRKSVLENCIVTACGYDQLLSGEEHSVEREETANKNQSATRFSPRALTRCVKNLSVMEEPVEHECVPVRPCIQPLVDGIWIGLSLDSPEDRRSWRTKMAHGPFRNVGKLEV